MKIIKLHETIKRKAIRNACIDPVARRLYLRGSNTGSRHDWHEDNLVEWRRDTVDGGVGVLRKRSAEVVQFDLLGVDLRLQRQLDDSLNLTIIE
jgi:hypothetical protein